MADTNENARREKLSENMRGHNIDFDTAVDRFVPYEEGGSSSVAPLDDDTKVKLGPKTRKNPNDPYCTC